MSVWLHLVGLCECVPVCVIIAKSSPGVCLLSGETPT